MTDEQLPLAKWLDAATEAFYDFMVQTLQVEQDSNFNTLESLDGHDVSSLGLLSGASLCLDIGLSNLLEIRVVSNEKNLTWLTHKILNTPDQEPVDKAELIDAIKEVANIISGGVKCRLNGLCANGIVLGLPFDIKEQVLHDTNNALWRKLSVDTIDVLLSTRFISQI